MRVFEIWVLSTLSTACAQKISTSGRCGPNNGGLVCTGSRFGNCCSQYGWCGKTSAYCGLGCQVGAGNCNAQPSSKASSTLLTATRSSSASSVASSASSIKISTNARCGYQFGATGGSSCLGSKWGDCCSQYSYCGSTSAYCGTGCQDGFGKCSSSFSSIKSSSSSSRTPSAAPSSTIPTIVSPTSGSASFSSAVLSSSVVSSSDVSSSIVSSAPLVTASSVPEAIPSSSLVLSSSSAAASSDTPLSSFSSSLTVALSTSSEISSTASQAASSVVSSDAPAASSPFSSLATSSVSSPEATPTPSASSTVVCYPAPTNYFTNAGFESTSGLSPWTSNVLRGSFSPLEQTSDATAVRSGSYGLRVSVPTTVSNAMFFEQANVPILAGTQLVASMWVKILAPPPTSGSGRAMSIQMYVDGSKQVAQILPSQQPQNTWINVVGSPFTLTGTSPHTIQVYFGVTGYTGAVLAFDDISLVAVSGPPGQPLCT